MRPASACPPCAASGATASARANGLIEPLTESKRQHADGFRQTDILRGSVRRRRRDAGARGNTHPRQPGRTGRPVPRFVRAGSRLRRNCRDRWTMSVGLYPGAERRPERPHLRDAARGAGIPRRALDRPPRPTIRRTGSLRSRAGRLSGPGARLDPPPRRVDVAAAAVARPRPCGDLSEMPITTSPPPGS